MSTYSNEEKSNCCQSDVHTEIIRVYLQNSSTEENNIRSFQAASTTEKNQSRASTENIRTTKNFCIRLKTSKGEWLSSPENPSESHGQLQFTSIYSVRLPSARSDCNRTYNCTDQQLRSNKPYARSHTREVPEVQQFVEKTILPISLREPTAKDVDSAKKDFATHHLQNHTEHDLLDGIQHCLTVCDQTQPANSCLLGPSSGSESLSQQTVAESKSVKRKPEVNDPLGLNVEGAFTHSNVIPSREYADSNAGTDSQVSASSPREVEKLFVPPSFSPSQNRSELDTDLDPIAEMFSSTLVTVLAPHWNGHFRRHKRDPNNGKSVTQLSEQNKRLSASCQNIHQHSFVLNQGQPREDRYSELHNKFSRPESTSRNSVEWQKQSHENLTSTLQSKRQIFKNSSLGINRQAIDQITEVAQECRPALSLQLSDSRRMSQSVNQGESYSSVRFRPTTSTLLLSGRRLNSRNSNVESFQMDKQLTASHSASNLHSKGISRISQPTLPPPSPNTAVVPNTFSNQRLSGAEKYVSIGSEQVNASVEQLYSGTFQITNKTSMDKIFSAENSNKNSKDTTRERLFSNSESRACQPKGFNSLRHRSNKILGEHQSRNGNGRSVEQTMINNKNYNINSPTRADFQSSIISSKETDLINKNRNLHSGHFSDSVAGTQMLSNSMQSTSTTNIINVNEANSISNQNMSKRTLTITSSPKPMQAIDVSPFTDLTTTSAAQPDHHSVQTLNSSDKPLTGPVHSIGIRTFTDSLCLSPKKATFVEETSPSHKWQSYLTPLRQLRQPTQSPLDHSSPQSSADLQFRRGGTPSIYSYLRESSTSKTMQTSPSLSSSPQNLSTMYNRSQILRDDRPAGNSRFSFDLTKFEQEKLSKHDLGTTNGPQSLPPDTGRKSGSRLSQSPYSTLISKRQRLNETLHSPSSPLESPGRIRSASIDGYTRYANTPKTEGKVYFSVLKDCSNPIKTEGFSDSNQNTSEKCLTASVSVDSPSVSLNSGTKKLHFAKCPSGQISTSVLNTKAQNQGNANKSKSFSSQQDKGKVCGTDILLSKDFPLPTTERVNGVALKGNVNLQTNKALHENQTESKHPLSSQTMKVNDLTVDKKNSAQIEVICKTTDRVEQIPNQSAVSTNTSKAGSSKPKDQFIERSGKSVGLSTISVISTSQKTPVVGFPETTQSIQSYNVNNINPIEVLSCRASSQVQHDNVKTCTSDIMNSKKLSLTPSVATISEDVQGEAVLQRMETVNRNPSYNLKKSFFSLLRKKDDVLTSASSEGKDDSTQNKKETTGFKTTRRVDQMLNHLKITFGVKLLDGDNPGVGKKTKDQDPLDTKKSESTGKDDVGSFDSPASIKSPNSQMNFELKSNNPRLISARGSPQNILQDLKETKKQIQTETSLGSNWPKPKNTQRENERSPKLRSPKSSNSQLTFMKESDNKFGSMSDSKTDRQNILPIVENKQLEENSLLSISMNSNWSKRENIKKEEEACLQSPILKSPKSPKSKITSVNESSLKCIDAAFNLKPDCQENFLNEDKHKRFDANRNRSLGRSLSPNWPDHYATLPHSRPRSCLSTSPTPYLFEMALEDVQNENVFYSPKLRKRVSPGETEDISNTDKTFNDKKLNSVGPQYSSCADLMYGLKRSRSVSVSSVVSGRPSGPGRISTGSKQGSISDLSSLDGLGTRSRHSSISSPFESPEQGASASNSYQNTSRSSSGLSPSDGQVKSPVNKQVCSFPWDTETDPDPTPPPSPPHSRRISQIPSPSPTSSRASPDGFSPRMFLPSKSYRSSLSVFDESDSDTTTDDEYYINSDDDDEKETEL